ncbi:uncharacterized protein LY79DRAFT_683167 [Colletotrichum navitas]|uniref:Uncharacterized protein n=1 Tax=Colletotrichum navitas TaxID=681940 RepID=A0AAD8Q2G5_9PEZI|nr:uncharacterized protein LY79DRAFT_683167 [Colletotrichum navitas]KAK1594646.1 hypothetical protein LY79DRAFT_683167 [Colletotrichum navitas]
MRIATISSFAGAILAATVWAAPVDPEQHPMVSVGYPQVPAAAELAAPGRAQPNPTSPVNLITAVWNAIAGGDEKQQREDLGQTRLASAIGTWSSSQGGKTDIAGNHADALIITGYELIPTPPPPYSSPVWKLSRPEPAGHSPTAKDQRHSNHSHRTPMWQSTTHIQPMVSVCVPRPTSFLSEPHYEGCLADSGKLSEMECSCLNSTLSMPNQGRVLHAVAARRLFSHWRENQHIETF